MVVFWGIPALLICSLEWFGGNVHRNLGIFLEMLHVYLTFGGAFIENGEQLHPSIATWGAPGGSTANG